MNLYGGPIDRLHNAEGQSRKNPEPETSSSYAAKYNVKKPDMEASTLTEEQVQQLKDKYNLTYMTCEEEEILLQDLNEMGILTKEDCSAYTVSGGNIFESLNRQVSADINLLYRMAISGKYCNRHIEHIRSQQKFLYVLEQLIAE